MAVLFEIGSFHKVAGQRKDAGATNFKACLKNVLAAKQTTTTKSFERGKICTMTLLLMFYSSREAAHSRLLRDGPLTRRKVSCW